MGNIHFSAEVKTPKVGASGKGNHTRALLLVALVVVVMAVLVYMLAKPATPVDSGVVADEGEEQVLSTGGNSGTSASTSGSGSTSSTVDDNDSFVIGSESMVAQYVTGGPVRGKERSVAQKLADQARRAKKVVKEGAVASDLADQLKRAKTAVKEGAVASDLADQLEKAKTAVKEGYSARLAREPNVLVNIPRNGIGHSRAPIGAIEPKGITPHPIPYEPRIKYASAEMDLKSDAADTRPGSIAVPVASVASAAVDMSWDRDHTYDGKTWAETQRMYEAIKKARGRAQFAKEVFADPVRAWSGDPGWNGYHDWTAPGDDAGNVELAMANELGVTGHSFTDNNIKSGIGQEEWDKQGTNWDEVKGKVLETVKNIAKLFDRLFAEEIFPDAVVDKQDNGQVYIRDGKEGKCIRVDRYYEYVESSVVAQLALGKVGPLEWGRSIELGFDAIEKAKLPLRSGMLTDCGKGNASYIISDTGEVKTAEGEAISITLPWPKDQSTLYDHPMVLGKKKK